ncbi:GNAT family N-acetyltransferase [Pseudooceanicola sp. CBS1P-1]|uniref:GNAT family N-acetyltransferase n=1 Tax=Pseudooceanicola albus TaxID=2692189 RepID=A0A6L7FVY9_9RHOB|nr:MULTISPECIES: GNAT family N-acetyltransferase [Pseudooceanicola]MBT9383404.1 GNAT family N-acetyltransferase [Pseudooceanicola endophyticus]MXN16274.1 GNAT family N-acetyltransferase [Pseudooceanicola albus]
MKDIAPPDLPRLRQHPHYARALRRMGLAPEALPGGGLLLRRRLGPLPLAWLPEPPQLPDLRPLGGLLLINAADAQADAELRARGALPLLSPQHHALLTLQPEAAQRGALWPKWRNRLAGAERAGLTIRHAPLPADPRHWLLAAEAAQRRARRYRGLPDALVLAWPETRLFTAHAGPSGPPIAAALFLLHAPTASYHIGWSAPEARACAAQNLLLWRAMRWLERQGIAQIDLGTVETTCTAGLARFKLGTGARIFRAGHAWLWQSGAAGLLQKRR